MAEKRYYWLKLYEDFFSSKRVKKLRGIAGGDTYTIIYLKMLLKAMKDDGYLYFDGIMQDFAEELALDLDEKADDVRVAVNYLLSVGLMESNAEDVYRLTYMEKMVGSESASTQRVRDHRARVAQKNMQDIEPKTNAERQNAYRAKKVCEENEHVPFIDDAMNKYRYGGNYYICFRRDKCECVLCGSKENLCMHHIDGYDKDKPQNNKANKMLTLCRRCHSNVHAGAQISTDVLESIGYYDVSNESNAICNVTVTDAKRNGNVEIDIEKEKEKIYKDVCASTEKKRFTPPSIEDVRAYCQERKNSVDPETFVSFYESNGWKVGRNSMKDWKAAVRTWERNRFSKPKEKFGEFQSKGTDLDELQRRLTVN